MNNNSIVEKTPFKNIVEKSLLNFDYEIITTKFDQTNQLNSKLYYYDKNTKNYSLIDLKIEIVNYNLFSDSKLDDLDDGQSVKSDTRSSIYKANLLKRLVSKKKKRIQNEFYDLDMSYYLFFIKIYYQKSDSYGISINRM